MTTVALENILLLAHKRDKNLSFLGFCLILFSVIIIAVLLYFFAFDFAVKTFNNIGSGISEMSASKETHFYIKLVLPLAFISLLIYPVVKLYQLNKRPKLIAEFIAKIDAGHMALSINQRTVYKITIPFIKINFRFAPIEYVTVVLDQDAKLKPYDIPIDFHAMAELKLLLSGINATQVNKVWDELYIGTKKENTGKVFELKSEEAFKTFLETELVDDILTLDDQRKLGKKKYIRYFILSIIVIAMFIGGYVYMQMSNIEFKQEYLVYGFMGFFGIFYLFIFLSKTIKNRQPIVVNAGNDFKIKILKPIIQFINPTFQFVLHGHLSLPELLETGLLENKQYLIDGNDQIIGNHQGVPFQLSDLNVTYKRNFSNEKEGPDQVFLGQVFIAKFNKSFSSELYLIPKVGTKGKIANTASEILTLGMVGSKHTDIDLYTSNDFGRKVTLEDPEFMKLFTIYCHDQIEARYILTPAMMDRIKRLATEREGNLFFSFKNDRISVLNNSGKNNFEVSHFKSISKNDNQILIGFYKDLCNQLSIINDLKLNINIWHKNK